MNIEITISILVIFYLPLMNVSFQQFKGSRVFGMEYLFTNCPVTSQHSREQGPRRAAYFTYEVTENVSSTVDAILADWTVISQLYQLVLTFAAHLSASRGIMNSNYDFFQIYNNNFSYLFHSSFLMIFILLSIYSWC